MAETEAKLLFSLTHFCLPPEGVLFILLLRIKFLVAVADAAAATAVAYYYSRLLLL